MHTKVKIVAEGRLRILTQLVHNSTLAFVGGTHSGGVYARTRGRKSTRLRLWTGIVWSPLLSRIARRTYRWLWIGWWPPNAMERGAWASSKAPHRCSRVRHSYSVKSVNDIDQVNWFGIVNVPSRTQHRTGIFHRASWSFGKLDPWRPGV